ncbi:hypothetical protein LTR10_024162 [Elasticomyces elasticus]|uniref:Acetoacetate decarboxylase n=1 Tax=Exophiala sideris TaxID=1016849 RepID=A0ABR0JAX8_9EURO|nr:hypothetical protein LTR10_024162 [Elasticomyces elasticus]KAK5026201.1 hypothetical protein LTS07_007726 [Exophiala sideris]KAK5032454.1 hypothetical protein LTR13_007277 [Exophiala sideris]KAK5059613.1 hypothetical protein LTR69_006202 [Exophiala sideris]KAK5178106.1 hypothetical protein LTR44_009412 [Eurotiomycetes sp. CCFEE 6388]
MTKGYHRMPLGYGPSPGPRQDTQGRPYSGWSQSSSEVYTVTFRAPRHQLAALLPHECFSIEGQGESAQASFKFTKLVNLPWLAGRGYNHFGLYIHDVVCRGKQEEIHGAYLSVLFENMADPIITGRDELGYAKVYATLDDTRDSSRLNVEMGWEGSQWGHLAIRGLQKISEDTDKYLIKPLLHLKYFPRTGDVGAADVEYPTVTPGRSVCLQEVYEVEPTNVELSFKSLGWSSLPTLHHIVDKLAGIRFLEIEKARFEIQKGGHDVGNQRSILVEDRKA